MEAFVNTGISSLVAPSGMAQASSGLEANVPNITVRVGGSGALCDLDERGEINDEFLALVAEYGTLLSQFEEVEVQRRLCLDPVSMSMLTLIQECRSRRVSFRESLQEHVRGLEERKTVLEKRLGAVRGRLGEIDARLLEAAHVPVLARVPHPVQPSPVGRVSANRTSRLPPKKYDFAHYFDEARLTSRQREVMSLRLEHGMSVSAIARRLGRHHSTIQDTIARASRRMDSAKTAQSRAKRRAIHNLAE